MPRIFLYSETPPIYNRVGDIAKLIRSNEHIENITYYGRKDSVLINQDFLNKHTKSEVIAAFAHEYGHRIDLNNSPYAGFVMTCSQFFQRA